MNRLRVMEGDQPAADEAEEVEGREDPFARSASEDCLDKVCANIGSEDEDVAAAADCNEGRLLRGWKPGTAVD